MGRYAEDTKELLRLVGGRENIAAVSHCMTRMRFALADPGKADVKAIEAMKVVKGSFTQSGQFQVIIGNTVADFYNDFVKEAGVEGASKEAVNQAAKKNQNVLQRVVTALAEIFAPLIPAIITGGLILGFRNCIDSLYLPVLGGHRQFSVVDRRGGIPYAAGWYLLVGDKKDGHHTDARHCSRPDAGIRTAAERLRGCRHSGGGHSQVEFWRLPGQYDRLSGPGHSCDFGGVYPGLSGKILPEDHAPGHLHDRGSVL